MSEFAESVHRAWIEHLREQRPRLGIDQYPPVSEFSYECEGIVVKWGEFSMKAHLGPDSSRVFFDNMPTSIILDHPDCVEHLLEGVDRYFEVSDKMGRVCNLVRSATSEFVAIKGNLGGYRGILMRVSTMAVALTAYCRVDDRSTIIGYSLLSKDMSKSTELTYSGDTTADELAKVMISAIRSAR